VGVARIEKPGTTRRVGRYFALGNTCPVQLFLVIIIIEKSYTKYTKYIKKEEEII